jgi:mannosyltransferase
VLSWLVVIIPALAELLVGGYQLGRASLWRDEGYTREVIVRPLGEIIAMLHHQDAVHGLYYLVMHPIAEVLGTSATALRLPSLIATSLAAGLTAALGRRLARIAGGPAAGATGLLAGLLLVALPLTTWYAQDARPYAMATLLAVGATYLFVRGLAGGSRWWWAGYAAAVVVLALLNATALLLVAAHGISLLLLRWRTPAAAPLAAAPLAADPSPADQPPAATWRWLAATAGAVVVLSPLLALGLRQSGQLGWVTKPTLATVTTLVADFAGAWDLIPLVAVLALLGIAAVLGRRQWAARVPAAIALPWLVLPPVVLLGASALHPVYVERYVIFCMPAVALLVAGGLIWLARLTRTTPPGRRLPALAVVPSALLVAVIAAVLASPQAAIRDTGARPDNLRVVAAVLSANERPGDVIMYVPWATRVVGLTYPAPFSRLRDIEMAQSPIASATLTGQPVTAQVLVSRFVDVRRLWTVRWAAPAALQTRLDHAEAKLISHMVLVRRWTIRSVVLSLYAARR